MVLGQHLPGAVYSRRGCSIWRGNELCEMCGVEFSNFTYCLQSWGGKGFETYFNNSSKRNNVNFLLFVIHKMRNLGFGAHTCLDSPARKKDLRKEVGLYPCHSQGGNQVDTTIYRVHGSPYYKRNLLYRFLYFLFEIKSSSIVFCYKLRSA